MSKKDNKKAKPKAKKGPQDKLDDMNYKNPVESFWGKLVIWILLFGMVGMIIVGTIWAIIEAVK